MGLNASLPATCFPTAATIANSWNEELGEEIGRALGEEAATQKVNVLLGPGLNIKRSPLCGRNFEYFSEDPYLAGKMAASYIRGIQSQGVYAFFGCGGVCEIPDMQDKMIRLARGGFKHHTSVGVGHMKEILKEAFTVYLGYAWVDIDG